MVARSSIKYQSIKYLGALVRKRKKTPDTYDT